MDLQLAIKGIEISKRKKKWLITLGLLGVSGYGVYRVYHLPYVARKRKRLLKLFAAVVSMTEMVSDSAETVLIVSRDLKEFLSSETDEIPNSLKQISKITRSDEFCQSLVRVTEALTVGFSRGYRFEFGSGGGNGGGGSGGGDVNSKVSSFTDQVLDKVFSKAGTGFVSVVVGSFARNLVVAFYAATNDESRDRNGGRNVSELPRWVNVLYADNSKELMGACIERFVSTAVTIYLDKTMDINTYDELFAGLTNPNHVKQSKSFLSFICNGAIETLVKTSHHVLTASSPSSSSSNPSCNSHYPRGSSCNGNGIGTENVDSGGGWVEKVTSSLSIPSNRKLILDVTGRVTFETIHSVVEFMLWKITEGVKSSFGVVNKEVVGRGLDVLRCVGAKSYVIVSICLALYLHILEGTRFLIPAQAYSYAL